MVFRLDPSRSHEVPEGHFAGATGVVLMVDRYSAYKAMAQVALGDVILVFCWVHVRRDFVKVGKAWPEAKRALGLGLAATDSATCIGSNVSAWPSLPARPIHRR